MIERVIAWSSRNRTLVLLLTAAAVVGGLFAMRAVPLDAIPDLTDPQVIVFTRWTKPPDVIENQVTYPLVTALLGAPRVKSVRGISDFGASWVYVIFEEGTDLYWARSRVLEYLQSIQGTLPAEARVELGRDATGVGWVFQYALTDRSGRNSLADLRATQDWFLRYALQATPGVAEVAPVGGFAKAYLVEVNPNALAAHGVDLRQVLEAVRQSSNEVGGRLLEVAGTEFMVRGAGFVASPADLEATAVGTDGKGTPIRLGQVARVVVGPDLRRGVAELDGEGEAVGGVVVMRLGENALRVIDRVKQRLEEIRPTLERQGVALVVTYDRSDLIRRAIRTLARTLVEEMTVVSLVCLLFLYHARSALVAIVMLPVAVILAFLPMWRLGVTSNIMSLGGIAIAIGAMVDAAVIMIENAHKRLEHEDGRVGAGLDPARRSEVILHAAQEVGRPLFFTLLVIATAFLPIFALEGQEGRLFKPLAYTKTFAMAFAALLSVTLVPGLMRTWIRGRLRPESKQPINRWLMRWYEPRVRWCLEHPRLMLGLAAGLVLATVPVVGRLGSEFMPPLNEGTLLYMPTTIPGISVTGAGRMLQVQDQLIRGVPEVARVFGKVGRADTPTDTAPLSMVETTITLKPEREWRPGMTWERIVEELDRRVRLPGFVNAWLMPIRNRIDMITTGIKTPVGVKVLGPDLTEIRRLGLELERVLAGVPGARGVIFDRMLESRYLDILPKREELARYGIGVGDLQMVIETALGGETRAMTLDGRARIPIQVRYARDYRDSPEAVGRILVPVNAPGSHGAHVPLGRVADIVTRAGSDRLLNEDGFLAGYVFVDVGGRDLGGFVKDAKRTVAERVALPPGYSLRWSGQYEFQERAQKRLAIVVPATLFLVFLLLYFNTKRFAEAGIVLLAVPFSLVGAFWLLWALGYHLSVAVWVGLLALAGIDAETGVVMLLYLNLAYNRRVGAGLVPAQSGPERDLAIKAAIVEGAVQRVRPKVMTVATLIVGLLPIMWGTGAGSEVMKRIAAPMVGGIVTSEILEFMVYPVIFLLWKRRAVSP